MFRLQISSRFWLLCSFLSIGCFSLLQRAQTAAVTDPKEVTVLESLAQKWNINTQSSNTWNLTGDPCTGRAIDSTPITDSSMNPAFKCDCSFNDETTCHIVQMKAYAIDIAGEIPEELANLTYLWDLNLGQNYLTGLIPSFLGNLTRLQYLSLGINKLSGPVPNELGNLHKLIVLGLSSNSLNGTLPRELGNLTALQELYIDSAGLSGEVPSTFRKLQNLKKLWASDNQFTGGIPDFIGSWKNLTQLGYLSPEYAMRGHLTEKADVFSYGVVALELVSGRSNTDTSLPEKMVYLLEWTWHLYEQGRPLELMDPDIESTCSKEDVLKVIDIALLCTQAVPTMRPSMSRVVAMLTGDVEVIPATSRPGYIKDLQYNNVIAGTTGTGSTPVVASTPLHNSTESLPILRHDSLTFTMDSAENVSPSKINNSMREGR